MTVAAASDENINDDDDDDDVYGVITGSKASSSL